MRIKVLFTLKKKPIMHPYDFKEDINFVTGDQEAYYNFIDKHYFSVCKDARVLEVGPYLGDHTRLITKHKPLYLECIEGNPSCQSVLKQIPGVDKVVIDDVWLNTDINPFDVVVCFGVLYHHHSALHLLELFVNCNTPKYLMLDCVTAEHPLAYVHEDVNIGGSRQVRQSWKHCGVNLKTPFFIINQSLSNMGYNLKISHKLESNWFPKSNGWVALWELQEKL
jgi:hypothetical protein